MTLFEALAIIAIAIWAEVGQVCLNRKRKKSRQWPMSKADVCVVSHKPCIRGPAYWRIQYSFIVDGRKYGNKEGVSAPFSRNATPIIEQLKAGDTIFVRYNPTAPDDSIIDHEASGFWMQDLSHPEKN